MGFFSVLVLTIGFIIGMDLLGDRIRKGLVEAAKIKAGISEKS